LSYRAFCHSESERSEESQGCLIRLSVGTIAIPHVARDDRERAGIKNGGGKRKRPETADRGDRSPPGLERLAPGAGLRKEDNPQLASRAVPFFQSGLVAGRHPKRAPDGSATSAVSAASVSHPSFLDGSSLTMPFTGTIAIPRARNASCLTLNQPACLDDDRQSPYHAHDHRRIHAGIGEPGDDRTDMAEEPRREREDEQ